MELAFFRFWGDRTTETTKMYRYVSLIWQTSCQFLIWQPWKRLRFFFKHTNIQYVIQFSYHCEPPCDAQVQKVSQTAFGIYHKHVSFPCLPLDVLVLWLYLIELTGKNKMSISHKSQWYLDTSVSPFLMAS